MDITISELIARGKTDNLCFSNLALVQESCNIISSTNLIKPKSNNDPTIRLQIGP